jgi:hypothetical protein
MLDYLFDTILHSDIKPRSLKQAIIALLNEEREHAVLWNANWVIKYHFLGNKFMVHLPFIAKNGIMLHNHPAAAFEGNYQFAIRGFKFSPQDISCFFSNGLTGLLVVSDRILIGYFIDETDINSFITAEFSIANELNLFFSLLKDLTQMNITELVSSFRLESALTIDTYDTMKLFYRENC